MSEPAHPTAFQLEAWHAGEPGPGVEEHVASCAACAASVRALDADRARFAAEREPPDAFARRLRERVGASRRPWGPRALGLALAAAGAAAGLALLLARPAPLAADATDGRLKAAGPGLALVVLEGGRQSRHTGDVTLRPGSRFRIELTVDAARPLEVGLLQDDGRWLPLAPPGRFDRGVHYLDRTLEAEAGGVGGRIVARPPGVVAAEGQGVSVLRVTVLP